MTHIDFAQYKDVPPQELHQRIDAVRQAMGKELVILGHHYQTDDVIQHADLRGDSFQLAKLAAQQTDCRAIVFCGVHFMAETADILANRQEQVEKRGGLRVPVILPELEAGCPMADMASRTQIEDCWRQLDDLIDLTGVTPVTYVNSSAAVKAFCGKNGGIVCTSSNARNILSWAFKNRPRVLFFPDQYLGRNTSLDMGIPPEELAVWDPLAPALGGNDDATLRQAKVILWQGFCHVHMRFLPEHVDAIRELHPGIRVIVHPECTRQVVEKADEDASTGGIIKAIADSDPGSKWAVGTEASLVERLQTEHPDKEIYHLGSAPSSCWNMKAITLPRLCWALENLKAGAPVNIISVDEETVADSEQALMRMLEHA